MSSVGLVQNVTPKTGDADASVLDKLSDGRSKRKVGRMSITHYGPRVSLFTINDNGVCMLSAASMSVAYSIESRSTYLPLETLLSFLLGSLPCHRGC
jgi:hypothetical protein